ncbi:uncharacterized protein LOC135370996 [Ornithodoros turicata]|uniref:uncharacterized protein LOC135370996 n=1 Tax=Ornithodoros turicata TaxID=34597 RepID=UPI00313A4A41
MAEDPTKCGYERLLRWWESIGPGMSDPDSSGGGGGPSIGEASDEKYCRWSSCNRILSANTRTRFILCDHCLHVTCLQCDASHEGVNCKTYRDSSRKVEPKDVSEEQFGSKDSHNTPESNSETPVMHEKNATTEPTPNSPQCDEQREPEQPPDLSCDELQEEVAADTEESELVSETPVTMSDTCSVSEGDDASSCEATIVLECNYCRAVATSEMVAHVPGCEHDVCRTCLERSADSSLTYLVKCPVSLCVEHVPETLLKQHLSQDSLAIHKELRHLPLQNCATDGCLGKCNVKRGMSTFSCPECGAVNCVPCRTVHTDLTCEEHLIRTIASLDGYTEVDLKQNGVRCGSKDCDSVGQLVLGGQLSYCPVCGELTCLECGVVHTFETCQEYNARLQCPVVQEPALLRSSVADVRPPCIEDDDDDDDDDSYYDDRSDYDHTYHYDGCI